METKIHNSLPKDKVRLFKFLKSIRSKRAKETWVIRRIKSALGPTFQAQVTKLGRQ